MRFLHYLRTAEKIIGDYEPGTPLPFFLRNYYRADRRMGATDRKTVSSLVYGYFRARGLLGHLPLEEQLRTSWFLCHSESTALLAALDPGRDRRAAMTPSEKLAFLETVYGPLDRLKLFPFHDHLTAGVDPASYALSMLQQPDLFLRPRPEKAAAVKEALRDAGIRFAEPAPHCLSMDNATRVDHFLEAFKGDFQVQDYSSQLTGGYFHARAGERWWDACAGSGGKSLLLHALEPGVRLHVSDHRPSILRNLRQRFREAGIKDYRELETDLIREQPAWNVSFDGIIVDAPCSGSGTWGRSPEMMAAFRESRIKEYRLLQETLVKNVAPYLKPGKSLIYITCSVFREENEELVEAVCKATGLKAEEQALLKGYEHKADTMFVARLRL